MAKKVIASRKISRDKVFALKQLNDKFINQFSNRELLLLNEYEHREIRDEIYDRLDQIEGKISNRSLEFVILLILDIIILYLELR